MRSDREPLTEQQANEIYDLLIQECEANEYWRENFVAVQTSEVCREYRFQGALGFGGKFRRNDGRWYVGCYPEDDTPARTQMIAKANAALAALQEQTEA